MATTKSKKRRNAVLSAAASFASFAYKVVLAVLTYSMVLAVASLSTLMVFIAKVTFVKNYTKSREKKRKAYLVMFFTVFFYSLIFILFVVLKVCGIDISNSKTYEGYVAILFVSFLLLMTILSCIGLKGALEKSDLMVIGLKEMTFVATLTDVVVILEFVTRAILFYKDIPQLTLVNNYAPLAIGGIMIVVSISMLVRYFKYEV